MGIDLVRSLADLPGRLQHRLSIENGVPLFQSLEWLRCLTEHGGFVNGAVRIFFDTEGCWALPMYQPVRGPLKSLSNYYSPQFSILGDADHADVEELVESIMATAGSAGRAELRHLKCSARGASVLIESFKASRFAAEILPQAANWYHPITGSSFDGFMERRSSRLQNTIRRARKRLARHHDSHFLLVDRQDERLESAIDAYCAVYGRSWKPRENHPEFVPSLIRLAGAHGRLRLGILSVDGVPAAAQLWFVDGGVSYIYKLAHDPQFDQLSVGSLLTAEMFRHVIEVDRVEEIDFGTGDEAYKKEWVTHRRCLLQLHAFDRRRARGWIALARRRVVRLARGLGRTQQVLPTAG